MWLSAIKLAVSAGSHIYKNKQQTKMLMSDAAMKHAQKMSTGELEYSGKLLEARQSDWKDEFILVLLSIPIVMLITRSKTIGLERRIYFGFAVNSNRNAGMVSLVR